MSAPAPNRKVSPTPEPFGLGSAVVVFGLASAIAWGAGDFGGGWASRRAPVLGVSLVVQVVGVVAYVALAVVAQEPTPSPATMAISVAAGVAVTIGIVALYHGLAVGRMGVVAPVTGLIAAVLPVAAGILRDGLPATAVLAGIVLALVAVVLVSRVPGTSGSRSGIELAIVGGAGIGVFNILAGELPDGQVFGPLVVIKIAAATVIVAVLLVGRRSWRMPRRLAAIAVAVGLFDMVGNACYVLATQAGRLDVAATLSSLYPVTTILLAVAFLGERVNRSHAAGIAAAVAAIALISSGSAGQREVTTPGEAISSPSASPSALPSASLRVFVSHDLEPGIDWRLLLDAPNTGNPGVEAATDEVGLGHIWTSIGRSDVLKVDLEREVVIFLNPIVSVDCHALKLVALHFDAPQMLLYGSYEAPPMAAECSDAAGSHLFVGAVARNALPQGPLRIRVMKDYQLCVNCGRSEEETEIDLTTGPKP